jgi:hypothetical protein
LRNHIAIVTVAAAAVVLNPACGNDAGSSGGGTGGKTDAGDGAGGNAGAAGGGTGRAGAGGSAGSATGGADVGGRGGAAGSATGGAGADGRGGAAGSATGGAGVGGGGGTAGSATGGAGAGGRGGAVGGGTGGAGAGGRGGAAGSGTGGAGARGGAGAGGGGGNPPVTCANPVFTTSDTNGGWSNGGYYVHNNVWNAGEAGPETLYACSFKNWYVRSTQPNTTSVKAYPNVHLDINSLNGSPISNYSTITSTFAATSPHVGIYNVAYDLWLNGVGWGGGTTEVMIWTENYKQVPLGATVAPQMTFGAVKYDVYRYTSSSDGGVQVITLLSTAAQTSGSVDLKAILNWIVSKGWISSNATVNQIGYGVEICSTENQPATFYFTDFSVTMK